LAWNDLQESLAALFWTLTTPIPQPGDIVNYMPLRIWAAIKSDRTQRDMLKEVVKYSGSDRGRKTMHDDLNWLIERTRSLEDWRNDAIHSPLFSVDKSLYGMTYAGKVAPAGWLFNPRAIKLSARTDLLAEFRFCRDTAITLSEYALAMDGALVHLKRAWPDRPSLPTRKPETSRQGHQSRTKQHPRQPSTSRA
jgi:hypothetical protein